MKYVIMCGGVYKHFETPKHLAIINGEHLVERTIRLLRENNVTDIYISSLDKRFDQFGVPRLEHYNSYRAENGKLNGYWLDAFYPNFDSDTQVTYLFGDVYYNDEAIKRIVNYEATANTLFGTGFATNEAHNPWGEPFAYKVVNYSEFLNGIKEVKRLQDEGKTKRVALVWELYRYLNNLNINVQAVKPETYVCIDDGTADIDTQQRLETVKSEVEDGRKISVIIPVYNRPEFLKRAINSIPRRCDLEIIVVDDGSTDGTTDGITEDDNLRIIRLESNQGVSVARNKGIEVARGKYLLMLDSDDYIITENFYKMELWLNTTDIIYFNLELNDGKIYRLNNDSKNLWCGTTKFIRKDFIGDTRYPAGVTVGEDLVFFNELQKKQPTEVFSGVNLIHYNHPREEVKGGSI